MPYRTLIAAIAILGFVAFAGPAAALSVLLHSPTPVSAQANTAPQFPSETTTLTVEENTPSFGAIGDPVTATDDDRLTYSLENAGTSHFGIDSSTGQLHVGTPLDYEARNSYTVKVIASDGTLSDSITVTINVTNVDERGTVSLSWRQPQVATQLEASLSDLDGAVSDTTWEWERSMDKSNWETISDATGTSYRPVTGDVGKYLRATASYTDPEGPGKSSEMVSYRNVRATPSNNNAPAFPNVEEISSTGYACPGTELDRGVCLYVKRSAPVGAQIYQPARAEDPDDDEVRYSLEGTDVAAFGIDSVTAELFTKQFFRDVDKASYTVMIKATDPSRDSDTIKATVTPSGGKGVPVVEGPYEIKYPEHGIWQVATYTAGNTRGPVKGWIVSVEPGGGNGDYFDIDEEGVLTFNDPPDYENPTDEGGNNKYSFSIMSYDTNPPNGQRPGQTIIAVKVIVTDGVDVEQPATDVNEAPEFPASETRARSVAENTPANRNLGAQVTATDDDNDTLHYTLGGDDASAFDIVSTSGQLRTKDPLDYETNDSYSVTVSVSDDKDADGNADTATDDTITVTITVTDVEEAPEFRASETSARSVVENTPADRNIGTPVAATDDDGDGDSLTYTLDGSDAGSFDIVETSGQLKTKFTLDYETKSSYSVTVSVRDSKDADGNADTVTDATITVTITVIDVEEPGILELSSTQPVVDTALTASLTDPDGSVSGVTWE